VAHRSRASTRGSALGVVIVVALVALIIGRGETSSAGPQVAHPSTSALPTWDALPAALPSDRRSLAADITRAQAVIDDRSSSSRTLASAGLFEQLATGALGRDTLQTRRATLAMLSRPAAASMRTNLAAAASLSELARPNRSLPHWRIAQPPAPDTLLGYFRAAQSRFGVRWEYLAAIEFIETRFGRVQGLSSAGAQGPMQFLPATWAQYGSGSIDNQRDAIASAARYLVANGAPGDMARALYHYNNSPEYVNAVQDYASRMRTDRRAYDGYYYWQVVYARSGGAVILPVGYPHVRPVPVH
jgi:membrane-bound lytic murein transglycosylase B